MESITKGSITKKTKFTVLTCAIILLILALIFLMISYTIYNSDNNKCIESSSGYRYDYPKYKGLLEYSGFTLMYKHSMFVYPYIHISYSLALLGIITLVYYFMISKMEISVSDTHVTGRSYFGRNIDLPMDSISAISTSRLNGISISTSSGKIAFLFIDNAKNIYDVISQSLTKRQSNQNQEKVQNVIMPASNADELKKYKELLDNQIITQEEFDAKKKQLLNL